MRSALRLLIWAPPIAGVLLYAIWHPHFEGTVAVWGMLLTIYQAVAFQRVEKLEKRIEVLESQRDRTSVSSTAP